MTEESRKIQIPVEVDATGAAKGFDQIKQGAQSMAQGVAQAGQTASKGIEGIAAAGEKLNVQQSRLIESIKKQSIIATEGKAAFLEQRAAMLGVGDAASGYIAKLKTAEQGNVQLGMSARATSAALRGVPAQFTDIVTSLQGGQKPLSVLLQQGGQLKDMFGGIGPAARALGGYVAGLVNPFTLAAAAIGITTYALIAGGKELREFQNAAILSGSALNSSLSQFTALRDNLQGIAGTKGKAAEALTEIAKNGKLAGDNIKSIAEAAILMEKATGQAIGKTIDLFDKLAESPVAASLELNKQYNYLTAAVYSQIKALEDQGKATQAAELAEISFAETLKSRATSVVQNVGIMEKAWRGLAGAAKGAWDSMLNIGREDSLGDKLAKVSAEIAKARQPFDPSAFNGNAEARAKLPANLEIQKNLLRQSEIEQRNATAAAEANRVRQRSLDATVAFDKLKEQSLTKQQKLIKEIAQAERDGIDAGKSRAEIEKVIAGIRERNKESGAAGTGQSEVAAIRAKAIAETANIARLRAQIADPDRAESLLKQTEAEKQVIKIQEELKTSISGVARAQKEKALVAAQGLAVQERESAGLTIQVKNLLAARDAYDKLVESTGKAADSILQQALGQEASNAMFGKSKTAVEELTLAQLKNSLAEAEASDRFSPAYVAALTAKTEAQKRYVEALQQTEFKQAEIRLTEAGRTAADETQMLQLELSLIGQTREVRERILGQRRAELKLAKELADIDKLNLGTGPEGDLRREELRAQARANSIVEANNAASKAVAEEWQRTADSINTSITDALLRGFESGKGFAANLRDTVVNMFKTMVLRPVVSAVVNTGTQLVGSALGLTQPGGGLGLGNILSAGNSLMGGNFLGSGSVLGSALGLSSITPGALAGANAIGAVAGGDAIGALAASQGWIAAGEGTALAAGSGAAAAGTAGGLSAGLAAIPGWGWAAIGAGLLLGMGGGGGKPTANTGSAAASFDAQGNTMAYQTFGGSSTAADSQLASLQSTYASTAKALGIQTVEASFNYGGNTGKNGESPNFSLGGSAGGVRFNQAETKLDDASLQLAASRAVFAALQGSQLPDYLSGIFDGLSAGALTQSQIDTVLASAQAFKGLHDQLQLLPFENLKNLTYAATLSLTNFSGGIEKFTTNLGTYYENFYSAQEKAANSTKQIFKTLGAAGIDVTALYDPSIESFRALVDAQDITTASGREAYAALLSVSGAFATLVNSSSDVSVATENLRTALSASIGKLKELSGAIYSAADANSPGLSRSTAQAQISAALAIAKASGVLPSLDSLAPALKALSAPSQDLFKTFIDYQRDQALTANDLNALGGLADGQISVQQAQLDALNKVNNSVLSVAEAVAALAAAEDARGAAILAAGAEGQKSRADAEQVAAAEAAARTAAALAAAAASAAAAAQVQIPVAAYDPYANAGYFAIGTNYVPEDMKAHIHKGERIIPAADNRELIARLSTPAADSSEVAAEIRALRQQVADLQRSSEQTAAATRANEKLVRGLTSDGQSLNTTVVS